MGQLRTGVLALCLSRKCLDDGEGAAARVDEEGVVEVAAEAVGKRSRIP